MAFAMIPRLFFSRSEDCRCSSQPVDYIGLDGHSSVLGVRATVSAHQLDLPRKARAVQLC